MWVSAGLTRVFLTRTPPNPPCKLPNHLLTPPARCGKVGTPRAGLGSESPSFQTRGFLLVFFLPEKQAEGVGSAKARCAIITIINRRRQNMTVKTHTQKPSARKAARTADEFPRAYDLGAFGFEQRRAACKNCGKKNQNVTNFTHKVPKIC